MEKTENSPAPSGEEHNEEDDARARSLSLGGPKLKVGGFGKTFTFLGEVREEMRKVTWPTRKMVMVETVVVLCVMAFFTLMITGLDQVFSAGFNAVLFNR